MQVLSIATLVTFPLKIEGLAASLIGCTIGIHKQSLPAPDNDTNLYDTMATTLHLERPLANGAVLKWHGPGYGRLHQRKGWPKILRVLLSVSCASDTDAQSDRYQSSRSAFRSLASKGNGKEFCWLATGPRGASAFPAIIVTLALVPKVLVLSAASAGSRYTFCKSAPVYNSVYSSQKRRKKSQCR